MTIQKTKTNKTTHILLKILFMIKEHFAKTMINSKTMGCFMSQNFACKKKIICRKKKWRYLQTDQRKRNDYWTKKSNDWRNDTTINDYSTTPWENNLWYCVYDQTWYCIENILVEETQFRRKLKKKNTHMKKTSKHENVIDALTEYDDWWDVEF